MVLPALIQKKNYIVNPSTGLLDKNKLLEDAYKILLDDFQINEVLYNGARVFLEQKILDCTVCDNNCVNEFCTCDDCAWAGKLDIFQHITSDEDPTLESRLTKEAKRKLAKKRKKVPKAKVRTPGEFSLGRTIRIPWIKWLIENANNNLDIQTHIIRVSSQKTKFVLYYKKQDYMVVLSRTQYANGSIEIYLNSAYHKPYSSLLRHFK